MACKDKNNLAVGQLWRRVYEVSGGGWKKQGSAWKQDVFAYNISVSCNHCEDPPCMAACPALAYTKDPKNGIVTLHADRCIGCRYCVAACPYGSRSFNWSDPRPHIEQINTEYPTRSKGVVEKCTFCIHRVREGRYPACVEICPVGARKFGNLLDEESEIRVLMREKRVFVLKEELNTQPKFYYFYAT